MQVNENIHIIYHVAIIGNWRIVLKEQLNLIEKSGLGQAATHIHLSAVGIRFPLERADIKEALKKYSFKDKVSFSYKPSLTHYEIPSLLKVKEVAEHHPDAKLFYFHTKGVSHGYKTPQLETPLSKHQVMCLKKWRDVMEFFNIIKWKECVAALEHFDCCGVEWGKKWWDKPAFFAGNFWWASARYILSCNGPLIDRYDCEYLIGTGKGKTLNMFNSSTNPRLRAFLTEEEIAYRSAIYHGGELMWNYWDFEYKDEFFKV